MLVYIFLKFGFLMLFYYLTDGVLISLWNVNQKRLVIIPKLLLLHNQTSREENRYLKIHVQKIFLNHLKKVNTYTIFKNLHLKKSFIPNQQFKKDIVQRLK